MASVEVALLDRDGVIVRTNAAWDDFCLGNGGDPARVGMGAPFLDTCASATDDPAATAIAEAIRRAVLGDLPAPLTVVVPCAAPGLPGAFSTHVSSRFDDSGACVGAIVTLSPAVLTSSRPTTWTPDPLAGLLRLTELRVAESGLAQTLQRLADSARELLDVSYAAISLSGPGGAVEWVVHAGIDARTLQGLDGTKALLDWLAGRPQLLEREVTLSGRRFATVYVAGRVEDHFAPNLEWLAGRFAEAAGTAIDNARLYQAAQQSNRWAEAAADLTHELASSDSAVPMEVVLRHAAAAAAADLAAVLVSEDEHSIRLQAIVGGMDGVTPGMLFSREGSPASDVMRTGKALLLERPTARARDVSGQPLGPMAVVPLTVGQAVLGSLVVSRRTDRSPFTETDVEALSRFIYYAGLAIELDRARADHERLRLHDDRSRIAIEMNDHVVRQLFAVGMGLEGIMEAIADVELRGRVGGYVTAIDESIRGIREAIYRMQED